MRKTFELDITSELDEFDNFAFFAPTREQAERIYNTNVIMLVNSIATRMWRISNKNYDNDINTKKWIYKTLLQKNTKLNWEIIIEGEK